jgi:acylpyruvate hydrolase
MACTRPQNFREHITELAQLGPEWLLEEEPEPILFLKPTSSYAWPGEPLVLPRKRPAAPSTAVHGIHHELELGVIIGARCKDVPDHASAMRCVAGYALGLDITERDEQTAAKMKGMPWAVSKGYDSFLPLSEPFELRPGEDWRTLRLWLDVNGERRQACEAGTMIHSVPSLICFISSIMTLEPGDLILTGTPSGVGPLVAGDRVQAGVDGHVTIKVDVVSQP